MSSPTARDTRGSRRSNCAPSLVKVRGAYIVAETQEQRVVSRRGCPPLGICYRADDGVHCPVKIRPRTQLLNLAKLYGAPDGQEGEGHTLGAWGMCLAADITPPLVRWAGGRHRIDCFRYFLNQLFIYFRDWVFLGGWLRALLHQSFSVFLLHIFPAVSLISPT